MVPYSTKRLIVRHHDLAWPCSASRLVQGGRDVGCVCGKWTVCLLFCWLSGMLQGGCMVAMERVKRSTKGLYWSKGLFSFLSGGHFMNTAEKIRLPDDCTIGYIIESVLGVPLTRSSLFHSHLENLQQVSRSEIHKQGDGSFLILVPVAPRYLKGSRGPVFFV
ncbi:hypothetical protein GOODEAATRI_004344 [Goodea atripinnis]|uniref:Fringe-like glycosyltransferase domain-containing protein n=1 Tax=Goodea atripinnis TaxID=208336 RepID=A0ABV0NJU0_9TELE